MCKYCDCDVIEADEGTLGERIGGWAHPFHIECLNDAAADFLDGRYWIVEKNERTDEYYRQIAINYCPVCGRKFSNNYF